MIQGNIDVADIVAINQQLEAENERLKAERDKAQENHKFMVNRAAGESLDGYRELATRASSAENKLDEFRAENERLQAAFIRAHDLAEIVADEFKSDDGFGAYETYTDAFEALRDARNAIDSCEPESVSVESPSHKWVPVEECGELAPGIYYGHCDRHRSELHLLETGHWSASEEYLIDCDPTHLLGLNGEPVKIPEVE